MWHLMIFLFFTLRPYRNNRNNKVGLQCTFFLTYLLYKEKYIFYANKKKSLKLEPRTTIISFFRKLKIPLLKFKGRALNNNTGFIITQHHEQLTFYMLHCNFNRTAAEKTKALRNPHHSSGNQNIKLHWMNKWETHWKKQKPNE